MLDKTKEYLIYLESERNLSRATLITAQNELDNLFIKYGGDVEQFLARDVLPQTRNKTRAVLLGYSKYLLDHGWTTINPMLKIPKAKTVRLTPKFLTPAQMLGVIDAINGTDFKSVRDRTIFEIGVCIASRTGDFKELLLTDVDLVNKTIKVFGKGRRESFQILTDRCIGHINTYLKLRASVAKCDYFLVNENGTQLKSVYPVFCKYLKGIINPHAFTRHSVAMAMLRSGADIAALRDLLRHSNIATTSTYLLIDKNVLRTTINNTHPVR